MTANDIPALENEILQAFDALIPYMPHLFEEEVFFGITDRFRFLRFVPSPNLHPNIHEGDPILPGDAIYDALRLGQPVTKILPQGLYGIKFKAVGIPVKDKYGQVIGGIGIGRLV